jgi:single-strand DNA-binding protein
MSMNLNDIKIVGNAVRDPELTRLPKGTPVANVSLGVNENYAVDGERKQITTFVDVKVFGASAENIAKLVHKGQEIFVEGALRQDQWEDKETGQKRSRLFIRANDWQFTQYKATEQMRQAVRVQTQGIER